MISELQITRGQPRTWLKFVLAFFSFSLLSLLPPPLLSSSFLLSLCFLNLLIHSFFPHFLLFSFSTSFSLVSLDRLLCPASGLLNSFLPSIPLKYLIQSRYRNYNNNNDKVDNKRMGITRGTRNEYGVHTCKSGIRWEQVG